MKIKVDLRQDIPGVSKFKTRLASSSPELNGHLRNVFAEASAELIEKNAKEFNQIVLNKLEALEAQGVFAVKPEHKAVVYSTQNTFFAPDCTVRTKEPKAEASEKVADAKAEGGKKEKPVKEAKAETATADNKDFEL